MTITKVSISLAPRVKYKNPETNRNVTEYVIFVAEGSVTPERSVEHYRRMAVAGAIRAHTKRKEELLARHIDVIGN